MCKSLRQSFVHPSYCPSLLFVHGRKGRHCKDTVVFAVCQGILERDFRFEPIPTDSSRFFVNYLVMSQKITIFVVSFRGTLQTQIQKNMKKEFVSKRDLGMAYFPNLEPMSARHKLCSLIHDDSTLYRRLTRMGYCKTSKCFSPNQLEAIFERLGTPW